MSYYTELKSKNLIGLTQRLLKAKIIEQRDCDGKFVCNVTANWDTPWVHVKQSYQSNCYLWKTIIFDHIVQVNLPKDQWFVPVGCQDCWKVVVRPSTLKQLFALESLQRRLDRPSKCGIEIRQQVFGNYGGYFYNRGLEKGLECYKVVRTEIDKHDELGPQVPVLLKRGCTEMEHGVGPSDKWEVSETQIALELEIKDRFVNDVKIVPQSEHAMRHVRQTWIEKAYEWGDPTVFEYIDGPLYPEYVTYHHLAVKEEESAETGNCTSQTDSAKDSV